MLDHSIVPSIYISLVWASILSMFGGFLFFKSESNNSDVESQYSHIINWALFSSCIGGVLCGSVLLALFTTIFSWGISKTDEVIAYTMMLTFSYCFFLSFQVAIIVCVAYWLRTNGKKPMYTLIYDTK